MKSNTSISDHNKDLKKVFNKSLKKKTNTNLKTCPVKFINKYFPKSRLRLLTNEKINDESNNSLKSLKQSQNQISKINEIKRLDSLMNSFTYPDKSKDGVSKYNIIYYPENDQQYDKEKTFTPFNNLLTTNKDWTKEFNSENEKKIIQQQLIHNTRQKFFIEKTLKDSEWSSFFYLKQDIKYYLKKKEENQKNLHIYANEKEKDLKALIQVQKMIEKTEAELMEIPENRKNKKPKTNLNNLSLNFKFFWYRINTILWKPENREGSTLTYLNGKCYLYGGKSMKLHSEINELDPNKWTWTKLNIKTDSAFLGRMGHSAHVYKNQLVIYGGEHLYNFHLKVRDCLGDLRIFDPEFNDCKTIRTHGDFVENRRNHASCVFGKFLFIMGGINSNGRFLSDISVMNLENYKWSLCELKGLDVSETIAFHTMTPIYRNDGKSMNDIYKSFDIDKSKSNFSRIKEEGIYIFGGISESGIALNQLRILKLGISPLKIIVPELKGITPEARYHHSMNFYNDLNILIIYGGRNDNMSNPIMSDVSVLNLFNMSWSKVSMSGIENVFKCSQSSCLFGSKLIVFGGYNFNEFINSDIYILELDQEKVSNYIAKKKFSFEELDGGNEALTTEVKPMDRKEANKAKAYKTEHKSFQSYLPLPNEETFKRNELQNTMLRSVIVRR